MATMPVNTSLPSFLNGDDSGEYAVAFLLAPQVHRPFCAPAFIFEVLARGLLVRHILSFRLVRTLRKSESLEFQRMPELNSLAVSGWDAETVWVSEDGSRLMIQKRNALNKS